MKLSLLLGAALALGQTEVPSAPRAYAPTDYAPSVPVAVPRAQLLPPSGSVVVSTNTAVVADTAVTQAPAGAHASAGACCDNACDTGCHPFRGLFGHRRNNCDTGCDTGCRDCRIVCLKPWTCDDLKMECEEPKCHDACGGCRGGFLHRLLYCPEEPEEEETNGEEKKNGNGAKKNGKNGKNGTEEKKNGEAAAEEEKEEEEEEEDTHGPLMQSLRCFTPGLFQHMECNGVKLYGFIQGGYTVNFDSPRDRLNYGVNFNNRSNDVLLNQVYLILEKPLDLDKKVDQWHLGYRVDFMYGHDAPYFENTALGLWPNFLGDENEASRLTEMGIGMWNFYVDLHAPILTKRGVDFRVGRFISLMGHDASLGRDTLFYSRPYEFFYGVPFTNTGGLMTVHVGDTLDIVNGIVRGYEVVFEDNNDACSYTGAAIWNSCDKKTNLTASWIVGPEQTDNDDNIRSLVTVYGSRTFGRCSEWKYVGGGSAGWDENAATNLGTGALETGEWYGLHSSLFYTISPKFILGSRFEWWRDDDGIRTAFATSDNGGARWNRPGYAGNFYAWTMGATYKPWQNFRLRPELRFDWFDGIAVDGSGSQPYNDQRDQFQTTLGIDAIWEF